MKIRVLAPLFIALPLLAQLLPAPIDSFTGHPRLVVLSDIGNEPDDQMSLVRLLLYSNEIDIEGLVATTSTWQKSTTHAETMHKLIDAYSQVRPNLLLHTPGWPEAAKLDALVSTGQGAYGMAATGAGKSTAGSRAVIAAAERDDPRPLWITLWGGANTLAQALIDLRASRSPAEVDKLVSRLRVYSISDQDDAGPWIRREFPKLFYVVQPSGPNSEDYGYAAWTGISGDVYYRNCAGASPETVTNEWLDTHIRAKGPLGKVYPKFLFIMEGDTPSYLGLINNGLNAWARPDWGGWGGRYTYRQPYGETHPIWTQGGDLFSRVTSQDTVTGIDGKEVTSDQATIWRWREAYQHDFAARMDWTVADFAHANHAPRLEVNGQAGTAPLFVTLKTGRSMLLDAGKSTDPDAGQQLSYRWFVYNEAGAAGRDLALVSLAGADTPKATVIANATCRPAWLPLPGKSCPEKGVVHVILQVTDSGTPRLTSYRRIVIEVHDAFPEVSKLFDYDRGRLPAVEVGLREERDGARIYDYSFAGVPGLLVVPATAGNHPLILYGHWMMDGSPLKHKGEFLEEAVVMARAGAVSLLLDSPLVRPGVVEDKDYRNAQSVKAGVQMVREWRQAIDLMSARPDVDASRIAYVGHSFNAGVGAKLAGVEKRIRWFVLMANQYSTREFVFDPENSEMLEFRKNAGDANIEAFLNKFPEDDSVLFAEHSAPSAVLLQYGTNDKPIPASIAKKSFAHFAEPKRMSFYEAGHELNAAARVDRVEWLKQGLGLGEIDRAALARIPPLR